MNNGLNWSQVEKMNPVQFRHFLNTVEPDTWTNLGKFFANYVTDTELERWITYLNKVNNLSSKIDSSNSFTQMLTYFLESVFDQAEKYNKMPIELKEFLESSENALIILGIHLSKSIKALETQKTILSIIDSQNYIEMPTCDYCVYSKTLHEIKTMITKDL